MEVLFRNTIEIPLNTFYTTKILALYFFRVSVRVKSVYAPVCNICNIPTETLTSNDLLLWAGLLLLMIEKHSSVYLPDSSICKFFCTYSSRPTSTILKT